LLYRVENGAATGMNGPEIDSGRNDPVRDAAGCGGEPAPKFAWDLAGEVHVEALLADAPGDELTCAGEVHGEKAVNGEADRLGANEIGGATIGEDEEGEQLFEILGVLKVQRAELEAEQQDFGVRFRANDMTGGFERVDSGVAAHESDEGALDGGIEAQVLDDVIVEPRGVETSAGGDNDVSDGLALAGSECKLAEGAMGELRGELFEGLHAAGGGGEFAGDKKGVRVAHFSIGSDDGVEEGIAMVDGRLAHHAAEEVSGSAVGQEGLGEGDEGTVHVVRRRCSGDAVEVGSRQDRVSEMALGPTFFFGQLIVRTDVRGQRICN